MRVRIEEEMFIEKSPKRLIIGRYWKSGKS